MAERELFVVCSQCGNEASPYVTECPYCGNRLRKRAPDLKKQRKLDDRAAKKRASDADSLRRRYERGGGSGGVSLDWLGAHPRPHATYGLVLVAIVLSIYAQSGGSHALDLIFGGEIAERWWTLASANFVHASTGYAAICLFCFALFAGGLEKRFGAIAPLAIWFVCGAAGLVIEDAATTFTFAEGSLAAAGGALIAWTVVVVRQEDLRDFDPIGLCAIAAVVCAVPILIIEASVWPLLAGTALGAAIGWLLSLREARSAF